MITLHLQRQQGRFLLRQILLPRQGSVGNQFYYARSANVTNLVSAGGAGTYTTGAVPVAELQPTRQSVVQLDGRLRLCIKMQVYHFEICQYMQVKKLSMLHPRQLMLQFQVLLRRQQELLQEECS